MGKSTLMNALIGQDLCVATRRPQTTRHAILGIESTDTCQLCLIDTPGVIGEPAYKLQEGMMEAVVGAFNDADVFLVVTDLFSTPIPDDKLFAKVQNSRKPVLVAINKVDLVDVVNPEENQQEGRTVTVEEAVAKWRSLLPQAVAIIPVIADDGMDNSGVTALRTILLGGPDVPAAMRDLGRPIAGVLPQGTKMLSDDQAKQLLPFGPPLYDEEALTDRSERFFASEIIRASLFQTLKKEVPYCCEVRITSFREPRPHDRKKLIRVKANILVERESQKPIVVGKGGETVKRVGIEARHELEDFLQSQVRERRLGCLFMPPTLVDTSWCIAQVHLELNVKVEKDWRRDEEKLKKFGYLK